ncbi:MAG: ESPR domain-containing protein, partial [Stenotrophomonas sp.]|uniref:ESPR domain-containing protein n=1 Tax=Stenotrophomonas sp. TaxID=69392 RepID=UPI00283C0E76
MNRIYRRVWNRQLNALVVASELATGDSGGSAARDPRAFLLMPTTLALALLCALASGHAGASETNQSLRDLQALAAKYAQPMPVKIDAEVALAAAARQAQSSPAISADARVGLQLNTASLPVVRDVLPASVEVKLSANPAPRQVPVPGLAADVRATVGVGRAVAASAGIDASLSAKAGVAARAGAKAKIAGNPIATLDTGAQVRADVGRPADGSLSGVKAAVGGDADARLAFAGHTISGQGQAKAVVAAELPAKEELPGETHDRAIRAAFDTGVAGKVRVQAPDGQEVVADRNLKLAGQATVAAQNSALGVGGLVNGGVAAVGHAVGAVGGALNGTVGTVGGGLGGTLHNTVGAVGSTVGAVGGAVGGALNGTVGTVGGGLGGTLHNTVGAVGSTVGAVGGAVGGALNGTVGTVGGAVGGALNNTVGAVGSTVGAVGGALNGTVGTVGGAVGGALNNTVGAVGSTVGA